jgi:Caspase domain
LRLLRGLLLLALCLPAIGRSAARFALVAGSDVGATGRARLWFAESDAERFGATLRELGDFGPDRVTVLRTPSAARFREALDALEARIRKARDGGERPLLVVYFSGHAGADGLELGNERIGFDELRARVTGSAAETRIAIVDACEAGLLTQVKGATAAPALDFPLPADDQARGTAFVTSTAVGEAAQESAAIGGSFFTHHLEIALRGAGDADGDGRITLAEAFRYTAARTLAGTAATRSGPQHATYDFKMSGRGDVVLADLRRADARLVLPADPSAQYVFQGPGNSVSEVPGSASRLVLALPAGRYAVERRAPEGRATTDLTLEKGQEQVLPTLTPTRYEVARSKGGPKPTLLYAGGGAMAVGLSSGGVAPAALIGARQEWGPVGIRITLAFGAKSVDDQGLIYDYKNFSGSVAALFPLNGNAILVEAGPAAGYGYVTQTLADRRSFSSGVWTFGGAVLVSAPVGPIRLGLDASAGVQVLTLNNQTSVLPAGSLGLVVLQGF